MGPGGNINPQLGFPHRGVNIKPPQPYRSIGWRSAGAMGAGTPGCLETGEVGGGNAPSSKQRGWNKTPNAKNREEGYQNKERCLASPGHPHATAGHPKKPGDGWGTHMGSDTSGSALLRDPRAPIPDPIAASTLPGWLCCTSSSRTVHNWCTRSPPGVCMATATCCPQPWAVLVPVQHLLVPVGPPVQLGRVRGTPATGLHLGLCCPTGARAQAGDGEDTAGRARSWRRTGPRGCRAASCLLSPQPPRSPLPHRHFVSQPLRVPAPPWGAGVRLSPPCSKPSSPASCLLPPPPLPTRVPPGWQDNNSEEDE